MSQPYIGEIRSFGFNFAPANWALCQGQLLQISQYDALFNLIGTTYGGDGQTTFGLPDLRSRSPIHTGTFNGSPFPIGQNGGVETVTLLAQQVGLHTHPVTAQGSTGGSPSPANAYLAGGQTAQYTTSSTGVTGAMLTPNTGGQPHDNLMPYLCINYSISLFGVYPSQN